MLSNFGVISKIAQLKVENSAQNTSRFSPISYALSVETTPNILYFVFLWTMFGWFNLARSFPVIETAVSFCHTHVFAV